MTALRSLLFHVWLTLLTIVMGVAFLPSLVGPRRWAVTGSRIWARLVLGGLRVICGLKWEARGLEHLKGGARLVAGKHMCMWETVATLVLLDDPAIVLKRELFAIPIFGWYARRLELIPIVREAHAKALRGMVADAKARLADGRPVAIYPEGTRKKPGAAPDYKPGVAALYAQLDVPCVPYALNSGLFWSGFWRRPGTIVIEFLPPIPPGLTRRPFMAELERTIETKTAELLAEGGFAGRAAPAPVPAA